MQVSEVRLLLVGFGKNQNLIRLFHQFHLRNYNYSQVGWKANSINIVVAKVLLIPLDLEVSWW